MTQETFIDVMAGERARRISRHPLAPHPVFDPTDPRSESTVRTDPTDPRTAQPLAVDPTDPPAAAPVTVDPTDPRFTLREDRA